jgi:hypothetical protein
MSLPINIPAFDDFKPNTSFKGYFTLVSLLTTVDETNRKFLFNLKDIAPYHIHKDMLEYILVKDRLNITSPYKSFLYIGLHQNERYFNKDILVIDEDLNVSSKVELSLLKPIRVTISFLLDITTIERKLLSELCNNIKILNLILAEYIFVYNNYKGSMLKEGVPNDILYRTFIYIINKFVESDDVEELSIILSILGKSTYIYNDIMKILQNNYSSIYNYLTANNVVTNKKIITSNNSGNFNNTVVDMKTVMVSTIFAFSI